MDANIKCSRVVENLLNQRQINGDAPIYTLSIKEFFQLVVDAESFAIKDGYKEESQKKEPTYIYGLRGIQLLFGVSHKTAQFWKNTWLAPACSQLGRVIMVDRDKAIELFEATGRLKLGDYGC